MRVRPLGFLPRMEHFLLSRVPRSGLAFQGVRLFAGTCARLAHLSKRRTCRGYLHLSLVHAAAWPDCLCRLLVGNVCFKLEG